MKTTFIIYILGRVSVGEIINSKISVACVEAYGIQGETDINWTCSNDSTSVYSILQLGIISFAALLPLRVRKLITRS